MPLKKAILNILEDLADNEKELLQKKALDEAILSSIGEGLVVVDKEGKITYVNQAFEQMVGWKSAEVIGKYVVEVVPRESEKGEVVEFNERILTKVLSGEIVMADLTNPFYYICKNKSRFPASSIVTPIILNNEIIGVVETFRDITKEKEIDKTKTEFVSLASHQLRTPLSTINWYTEMLLAGDVGKLNPEQEKYLKEVYRGNQRMVSLVNALLSVSRMDLGTFTFELEQTDVTQLVQNVVNDQKPQIEAKGIKTSFDFETKFPIVQSDPKVLRIIFENLLSNSVKYTPDRGKIKLTLSQNLKNKTFTFSISDTGYGIPENQQNRIFSKLFRADNVRQRDTEGTGLGLYIVKAVVDNSGGKVWFESKEDKGTIFHVEFPISINKEANKLFK